MSSRGELPPEFQPLAADPSLDNLETPTQQDNIAIPLNNKGFPAFSDDSLSTYYVEIRDTLDVATYKQKSQVLASALASLPYIDWQDRARKIDACGSRLVYNDGRLWTADFCRLRACPLCQRRRSLRTYADFCRMREHLAGYDTLHLVLTVPNVPADELPVTLSRMYAASSRFFRLKPVASAFKGAARCLEVSVNFDRQTMHPHFHCLIAVKPSYFKSRYYLRYDDLRRWWSAAWELVSDGLRMDRVKDHEILDSDPALMLQINIGKADQGALAEIAKYAVKPFDFGDYPEGWLSMFVALQDALHGRRLVQLYGVIRDAARDAGLRDIGDDGEEKGTDNMLVDLFAWDRKRGTYAFERSERLDNSKIVKSGDRGDAVAD